MSKSREVRGVIGEEGKCGDAEVKLLGRERQSLDILSVNKEARLFVRALADVQEVEVKEICGVVV